MKSKLEELIEKLCPNGVEYRGLGEICSIQTGKLNANAMVENGKYPFFTCDKEAYQINEYAFDVEAILISGNGSQVGHINYYNGKFNAYQRTYVLSNFDKIYKIKFIYHFLKDRLRKYILKNSRKGSIPYITLPMLSTFTLPLPPIEVQEEIVRILDELTEATTKLITELTTELTLRKQQYEYYRDELLNKKLYKNVLLKNVVKKGCSGGTPKKGEEKFYLNGTVPWLRTQDIKFNEIFNIETFITEEAVKQTSAKWISANCVIVAISGATAGRCAINKIPTTTNQHCYNMEIDETKALYKYIYYCVCNQYEELIAKKQGARGDLNSSLILGISIPLPSIEEQQRIVDILDRFDKLVNDIKEGLPAEIEMRQKQYEYYRDKLLNFKKLNVEG